MKERKEHGLMVCWEMILALLAHRKHMTRRTRGLEKINENPDDWVKATKASGQWWHFEHKTGWFQPVKCPYAVGDFVYAKEKWATRLDFDNLKPSELPTTAPIWFVGDEEEVVHRGRWRSSMFMPKKVARIWREIVGVRCERLQTISKEDIENEGEPFMSLPGKCLLNFGYTKPYEYTREHFAYFWDRLDGKKHPWSKDSFVWVLSLKEVK